MGRRTVDIFASNTRSIAPGERTVYIMSTQDIAGCGGRTSFNK